MRTLIKCLLILGITLVTFSCRNTISDNKPEIVVKNDSFSLGNLKLGDTTTFTITLKNNGKLPYKINDILASCGCLEIEYDPNQKILPEETLDIPVDFIAKQQGLFHKTITIKGNTKPSFTIFNFFGEVSGNKINQ
jgi:hypothetical protein